MKITKRQLQMIIAEEVARAEVQKRRAAQRRARLDESGRRIVEATPELINRIIREEMEKLRGSKRLSETAKRRMGLV